MEYQQQLDGIDLFFRQKSFSNTIIFHITFVIYLYFVFNLTLLTQLFPIQVLFSLIMMTN